MRLSFAVAVLILSHSVFAQKTQTDPVVAELQAAVGAAKEPEAKAHAYRELIQRAHDAHWKMVLRAGPIALSFVESNGTKIDLANTRLYYGRALWKGRKFDEAILQHQRSLTLFREIDDKEGIGLSLNYLAQDFLDSRRFKEAESVLGEAFRYWTSIKREPMVCFIHSLYTFLYSELGEYSKMLANMLAESRIYEKNGDLATEAICYANIGRLHQSIGDYDNALLYFRRTEEFDKQGKVNDKYCLVYLYTDMGNLFVDSYKFQEAKEYLLKARTIAVPLSDPSAMAVVLSGSGRYAMGQGNYQDALREFEKALELMRTGGANRNLESNVLSYVGTCQLRLGRSAKSREAFRKAYALLKGSVDPVALSTYYDRVEEMYRDDGEWKLAYVMFRGAVDNRKRISNHRLRNELAQLKADYEFEQKDALAKLEQEKKDIKVQAEQAKKDAAQRNIRNSIAVGFGGSLMFLGVVFSQRNRIAKEKKVSEELLLNILPSQVADELKAKGSAEAKLIDEVTVLFSDFKGFTALAATLTPEELVSEIDTCFRAFDQIMQSHGVEKIKTVGDAYLAAGGLPTPNTSHANDVVSAALEMRDFILARQAERAAEGKFFFEMRVGIHTGPVVAGIVGVKKFAYDIWGDTVNTAQRMESACEPGRVNVSASAFARIQKDFDCQHRGMLEVKGKEACDMYYVAGWLLRV